MAAIPAWNSSKADVTFWICDEEEDKPDQPTPGSQAYVKATNTLWAATPAGEWEQPVGADADTSEFLTREEALALFMKKPKHQGGPT